MSETHTHMESGYGLGGYTLEVECDDPDCPDRATPTSGGTP